MVEMVFNRKIDWVNAAGLPKFRHVIHREQILEVKMWGQNISYSCDLHDEIARPRVTDDIIG